MAWQGLLSSYESGELPAVGSTGPNSVPNFQPQRCIVNEPVSEEEICEKARKHYARECAREGCLYDEPANVEYKDGEVELSNVRGTVARYTVRPSGRTVRFDPA